MIRHDLGPGVFPDAAFAPDGRWLLAYRAGDPRVSGHLVVRREGEDEPIYAAALPGGTTAFPRIVWPWLAYVGADDVGSLVQLETGAVVTLGRLWGNHPAVVSSRHCAYQSITRTVWRFDLANMATVSSVRAALPTGLASVDDNGHVVMVEDVRTAAGPLLFHPRVAADLTVAGTHVDVLCRLVDGRECRPWAGVELFNPNCAAHAGRYAVAAWGQGGIHLAILTPADFGAPLPLPGPPGAPAPDPPVEEPMPQTDIPDYQGYFARADALLPGKIRESHDGAYEVVNLGLQLARKDGHDVYAIYKDWGEHAERYERYADSILIPIGGDIGQVVDVVMKDGGPEASIGWIVQDTRPMSEARLPFDWPIPGEAVPRPPATPDPPADPPVTLPTDIQPVLTALEGITARLDALLAAINAQRAEQAAGLAQVAQAAKDGIRLKLGF